MTNEPNVAARGVKMLSITAVERDCGLPKETLRVWERRYGFPKPFRDANDERVYPQDQVLTLRLLRRLIDAGHRPGKIVGLSVEKLGRLASELDIAAPNGGPEAEAVLDLLRTHEAERLRQFMSGMLLRQGLRAFAAEIAPILTQAVGAAWARGELEIHEEHLFTEQLNEVLRSSINAARSSVARQERPLVLLTTFPQEPHALGLLMAEAMFILEGCRCVSLGVQTPISDIAAAARAQQADILALSFSSLMTNAQAQAGLTELRALASDETAIWAGGACVGLREREGVRVVRDLGAIASAVADWRTRPA
jgi:DNA-binding transcriptional MerR regulator/methylmalonyl-CoA mutase cobalamin-binding subunit